VSPFPSQQASLDYRSGEEQGYVDGYVMAWVWFQAMARGEIMPWNLPTPEQALVILREGRRGEDGDPGGRIVGYEQGSLSLNWHLRGGSIPMDQELGPILEPDRPADSAAREGDDGEGHTDPALGGEQADDRPGSALGDDTDGIDRGPHHDGS